MRDMSGAKSEVDPARPSIRSRIAALVLVCVLPMWLLAVAVSFAFSRYADDKERQHGGHAAALLGEAVDAELGISLSALQVLAASPLIDDGDYRRWYDQALEVRQAQSAINVTLLRPDLQTLVTLDRPYGQPAPRLPVDRLPSVMATGRPAVSDLFVGSVNKRPLVSLAVPSDAVPSRAGSRWCTRQNDSRT